MCFLACILLRTALSLGFNFHSTTVGMYGQHFQQSMDQPGMVAHPARGQLKGGKNLFPFPRSRLRTRSRDTGSVIPSRVSPLILHTQAESGPYSRGSSRFPRRRPHIPSTASGSVPSLSGHAIAYRWRSLPRVRRHRASSPQGSSSNGCRLFRFHRGVIFIRLSFPTPLLVCRGHLS